MIEIAASYDENVNIDSWVITHILIKGEKWKELDKVTTKAMQSTLKVALNKLYSQNFNIRLGTTDYYKEFIGRVKKQYKNVKLMYICFRLVSKHKMVNCDKFSRCGEVQSYRSLLWECGEARKTFKV
jgi:7-cyano-7-deazaguanine synthase in queuosine biosynthesis